MLYLCIVTLNMMSPRCGGEIGSTLAWSAWITTLLEDLADFRVFELRVSSFALMAQTTRVTQECERCHTPDDDRTQDVGGYRADSSGWHK